MDSNSKSSFCLLLPTSHEKNCKPLIFTASWGSSAYCVIFVYWTSTYLTLKWSLHDMAQSLSTERQQMEERFFSFSEIPDNCYWLEYFCTKPFIFLICQGATKPHLWHESEAWIGNTFHYSNSNLHAFSQSVFCIKAALYYPPLNLCW